MPGCLRARDKMARHLYFVLDAVRFDDYEICLQNYSTLMS